MSEENIENLEKDIIDFFKERLEKITLPVDMKILFLAKNNQKQLIKLTKIPEHYAFALEKELLVEINPKYFDTFNGEDEKINEILFDQEIDKIEYNFDKGTFKISKPTIATSIGIVDKYTYEEVQRAIEVERLFKSQKNDMDKE